MLDALCQLVGRSTLPVKRFTGYNGTPALTSSNGCTQSAYSVAFCFYNSLTVTLCEYRGRFYGGGVGELVPSEFKSLCIPYNNINIEEIFDYVDSIVLEDLSITDIKAIKKIREKYLLRRLKEKIE